MSCNWFTKFRREKQSLKDNPHSMRPYTAVMDENIIAVKDLINEDRHIP